MKPLKKYDGIETVPPVDAIPIELSVFNKSTRLVADDFSISFFEITFINEFVFLIFCSKPEGVTLYL